MIKEIALWDWAINLSAWEEQCCEVSRLSFKDGSNALVAHFSTSTLNLMIDQNDSLKSEMV